MELEIRDEHVVRFPCWAWQRVFCEDYLATNQEEYETWIRESRAAIPDEDTWPLPQPWRLRLEGSWERLFSPELPIVDWDKASCWSRTPCVEAVLEQLRLADVRHVTLFTGSFHYDDRGKSVS